MGNAFRVVSSDILGNAQIEDLLGTFLAMSPEVLIGCMKTKPPANRKPGVAAPNAHLVSAFISHFNCLC